MTRELEPPLSYTLTRRRLLQAGGLLLVSPFLALREASAGAPAPRLTRFELIPIRATSRTVWLVVRLHTDAGLTGLGEASDAFGFANTTAANADTMRARLQTFFELVRGGSPLDVERYRQRGIPMVKGDLVSATAFSAIEQAMWDLAGKALNVPTHVLFGGKVRAVLPVYANINRATNPRTPEGFAGAARRAVKDGFRSIKAAPWDGFPATGSPAKVIDAAVDAGIAAVVAMREAAGTDIDIMVDCHSFFDVERAVAVARRLEPQRLRWYEEPVAPERVDETVAIKGRIQQPMAGGEVLFGVAGFAPLYQRRAVDVIMPDVKHCGGLLELTRIAAAAEAAGVMVSPHNPSGPVSTAASVQVAAGMGNFNYLELQYGEVDWRGELLAPIERFVNGQIAVPDRPGFGIALNEQAIRRRALAL
ncbi:MAG TPA: mandelate racemase/muconate lactonizing enzyme family protein [Vicinamibacterales bacterium]|nr:mandelate racemase/muconate lactonizing enzyme family protein [Vicinamibacterales bacterium]